MKSVILFVLLSIVLYIVLKKYFVLRCPQCSSRYINRTSISREGKKTLQVTCRECGHEFIK